LLLVVIARCWLSPRVSLLVAVATWFGTSFASTEATALWSHDFATLFALVAIALSLKAAQKAAKPPGLAVGAALFAAYFCRPTLSLLTPAVVSYLFFHDRRQALRALAVVVGGLALFVVGSEIAFRQPLPDYYLPQRLAGSSYWTALFGNLVSPSRGLLVFSPLFLLPLVFLRDVLRAMRPDRALWLIAVAWPLFHLLLVSRLHHWWAGYSFGPRFMTDVLPGLFVLLCLTLSSALERHSRAIWPLFAVLATFSCAVHTVQGLYARAPKVWNAKPNIDQRPELIFDWRYPQFMNTAARQRARVAELMSPSDAEPENRTPEHYFQGLGGAEHDRR
jgi:hypothetical protein